MPVTVEQASRQLRALRDFPAYARANWTVPTKSKGFQPVRLTPAQKLIWAAHERQMEARGFVRLQLLKCRQVGGSTFCRMLGNHYCLTHSAVAALSIAHDKALPTEWLSMCSANYAETPEEVKPGLLPAKGNVLRFADGSRYGIGSAQGGFPGMGHTLQFVHISEIGRWDKPPISVDPQAVLLPLDPAIPTGDDRLGSVVLVESTGVMVGDHWYKRWQAAKEPDSEYENLMLPWFLVPSYRRGDLAGDVLSLNNYEQGVVREAKRYDIDLDHAQLAWRRITLRQAPYLGHEDEFKAEYPATEDEGFMSPGVSIYKTEVVQRARETVREPIWVGNLWGEDSPDTWGFLQNPSGLVKVWEWPDERYHYVLGADCQWGKGKDADWNALFVECLETGKIVAKVKSKYEGLRAWARMIAAMGFKYNACPVAPEITGQQTLAGQSVMPVLLGNIENWRYPNVWVRSNPDKLRGHKPEDYGWHTTHESKGNIIVLSESMTINREYDWADAETVEQMGTIIRHADNTIGAPEGLHDDDWMARIITGAVAHRERAHTTLYEEPKPFVPHFRTPQERIEDLFRREEDEDE